MAYISYIYDIYSEAHTVDRDREYLRIKRKGPEGPIPLCLAMIIPTYGEISQPCEDNPEAYKLYHAYGNEENT